MVDEMLICGDYDKYKYDVWDKDRENDYKLSKEKILLILKEQKVSLSEARYLFHEMLTEIERKNPINI